MAFSSKPGLRQETKAVKTTCPYCGVGCGVVATRSKTGTIEITGDGSHPANRGRLCSKGSALAETLGMAGRLLAPRIDGVDSDWDTAIARIAGEFTSVIERYGPEGVAFYVSGQLLTEDYYIANKLMKGFIGSANIDTNSRLCMASSVAGHKRAFGADVVPGCYDDLETADLVVLVGSNLAWCHPVLFQRLIASRKARPEMQIVVIDPRRTATAEIADLHLPIRPGGDVPLFNGLLRHLAAEGAVDAPFVDEHTVGLKPALEAVADATLEKTATLTGLAPADLQAFYAKYAGAERTVTVYSQGVNQAADGTDKVNAIINCHLYTGRIGREGCGPFSVTGQPNAMGGREVGGLANQLTAHLSLENPDHRQLVKEFWQAPVMPERPGFKAVELFQAVRDGRIKAIWIVATNPVDSMPDADGVREALEKCPFVVVSEVYENTDTAPYANVLLPARAWGEKDGMVTNSERCLSRQRTFLEAPRQARADWKIFCDVAAAMGWSSAFSYETPGEIFREFAELTARANAGERSLDLGELSQIDHKAYESFTPAQWPVRSGQAAAKRLFGDGRFDTDDRKARFVPTAPAPAKPIPVDRPFTLNTGRIRDQWHTMTRSGRSPRLSQHQCEPYAELHPRDAERIGVDAAELVSIESPLGNMVARALVTTRQQAGSIFVPMHWTDQFASNGRVDSLIGAHCDPVSGQPALKSMRVHVTPYRASWYAFAITRECPAWPAGSYWAAAAVEGGYRAELAGRTDVADWDALARKVLRVGEQASLSAYHDLAASQHRFFFLENGRLAGALFVAPQPVSVSRSWLCGQMNRKLDGPDAIDLLAGRPRIQSQDTGAIVCSCFGVGVNQIAAAISTENCRDIESVGAATMAGTNCGSCRAEIQRMIDHAQLCAAE